MLKTTTYFGLLFLLTLAVFSEGHTIKKRFAWRDETNLFWSTGCEWSTPNLAKVLMAGDQCGPECARRQGCTHFTWTQHEGGTCNLKAGSVTKDQATSASGGFSVCGIMKAGGFRWVEEISLHWTESCDWKLNSIGSVQVPGDQCGGQCSQKPGCTHFTWVQNDGTCIFKSGAANRGQAVASSSGYTVCGKMKPRSTGTGSSVKFVNHCGNTIHVIKTEEGKAPAQECLLQSGGTCSKGYSQSGLITFKAGWSGKTEVGIDFNSFNNMDYYDLSVIDGYDTPIQVSTNTGGPTIKCKNPRCNDAYSNARDDSKRQLCRTGGTFEVTFCP